MALAHADPHKPTGVVRRGYVRFLRTPAGYWMALNVAPRVDPWLLRTSGGRVRMGLMLPSALLESTGAKSGQPRETTLLYFHDGADVIVIASSYGRASHPSWYHNLLAHPQCRLGGDPFTAELIAEEAERTRVWAMADKVYAGYADYRDRTAAVGRTIPLFRLRPRAA